MLQTALEFLRKHNEITFATTDGTSPRLRIFQIMRQEGTTLYFATSSKKAVWHELHANPNVELLAFADKVLVRCSGMVSFDVSDDVKRWIYDNNPVLPRLYTSYDKLEYFCLPIAELDYFDLSPTPPINQHFDLMAGEVANGFVGERFSKLLILRGISIWVPRFVNVTLKVPESRASLRIKLPADSTANSRTQFYLGSIENGCGFQMPASHSMLTVFLE